MVETEVKAIEEVTFVCISDTHAQADRFKIPDGDVLIHAGDFSNIGLPNEVLEFNKFLKKNQERFKHIIVIAGNHDLTFDLENFEKKHRGKWYLYYFKEQFTAEEVKKSLTECIYLEDSSCEVFGYKVYGSPWTPDLEEWGFNIKRGEESKNHWSKIPTDTDILITHGPPYGFGDTMFNGARTGDQELLEEVKSRVKPLYHIFGHIHEDRGIFKGEDTTFINAAMCDMRNKPKQEPIVFKLPKRNKV